MDVAYFAAGAFFTTLLRYKFRWERICHVKVPRRDISTNIEPNMKCLHLISKKYQTAANTLESTSKTKIRRYLAFHRKERKPKNSTHLVLSTSLSCSSLRFHAQPSSSATTMAIATQQKRKKVAIVPREGVISSGCCFGQPHRWISPTVD